MTAGILAIGLDACEATLIERWAGEGRLPTFARLIDRGARFRLGNPLETLPGAIWPELVSGRSAGRVPLYYHPDQLRTGEARGRRIRPDEVDPADYYWVIAARAGRRVAALDLPQTVPDRGVDALQLMEWGLHDRHLQVTSHPPSFIESIPAHPLTICDLHGCTEGGYRALLDSLLTGVALRNDMLLDVLNDGHWDLLTAAYSETHCAGHQFWHFLDERHPRHQAAPAELREAIFSVYRRIDEGIGRLIEAAGPAAHILVYTSHGMGPYLGGPYLLDEVLVRLGLSSGGGRASTSVRNLRRALQHAPLWLQPLLRRMGRSGIAEAVTSGVGAMKHPLRSPRTRAVALKNNRCGAIRLNLAGREPHGRVQPGAEAEALIGYIRDELLALEQPGSGARIVERAVTAAEAFGPDHHPDVPDLMVVFRTDLGPLESCRSARVGEIRVPLFNPILPRTGDHTVQSRLWAAGPGVPAGMAGEANVLDIAPTVLALLGLAAPARIDGRPIAALSAPAQPATAAE